MVVLREPENVFMEFLRAEVKEPARSGLSKRHTNATETFSGNASTTEFTVTSTKLLCINEITISAVKQNKHSDYTIDLRNNKVIFTTAPASGTDNISIDYDFNTSGISWIYAGKPQDQNLKRTDYPRIDVVKISENTEFLGLTDSDVLNRCILQVDVVTKEKLIATNYIEIDSAGAATTVTEVTEGEQLVRVLARQISNAAKRQWRNEIKPVLFWVKKVSDNNIPFEEAQGIFRRMQEWQTQSFDLGEEQA